MSPEFEIKGECGSNSILLPSVGRSLHVGITGGIACGKSHVSKFFSQMGSMVLDADQVSRQVVQPGCAAYREILAHFGSGVRHTSGHLDRRRLASIIFADPQERQALNAIVHPHVAVEVDSWLRRQESVCPPLPLFVEAALLAENGRYRNFDYLIVAYCLPEIQLQRIVKRDLIEKEMAEQRIQSQMPLEEKKKLADFLVDTSGSYRHTRSQVMTIFSLLQQAPIRRPTLAA